MPVHLGEKEHKLLLYTEKLYAIIGSSYFFLWRWATPTTTRESFCLPWWSDSWQQWNAWTKLLMLQPLQIKGGTVIPVLTKAHIINLLLDLSVQSLLLCLLYACGRDPIDRQEYLSTNHYLSPRAVPGWLRTCYRGYSYMSGSPTVTRVSRLEKHNSNKSMAMIPRWYSRNMISTHSLGWALPYADYTVVIAKVWYHC